MSEKNNIEEERGFWFMIWGFSVPGQTAPLFWSGVGQSIMAVGYDVATARSHQEAQRGGVHDRKEPGTRPSPQAHTQVPTSRSDLLYFPPTPTVGRLTDMSGGNNFIKRATVLTPCAFTFKKYK